MRCTILILASLATFCCLGSSVDVVSPVVTEPANVVVSRPAQTANADSKPLAAVKDQSTTAAVAAVNKPSTATSTVTFPTITPSTATTTAKLDNVSTSAPAKVEPSSSISAPHAETKVEQQMPKPVAEGPKHHHINPQALVAEKNCSFSSKQPKAEPKQLILGNCIYMEIAASLQVDKQFLALENPRTDINATCPTNNFEILYDCAKLRFVFKSDVDGNKVLSINGLYTNGTKESTFSSYVQPIFKAPQGYYYKCHSEETVLFENSTAVLHVSNFAFEINRSTTEKKFVGSPTFCPKDAKPPGSDWVTLSVGVCLLALIAIVLVAYFVGRKRWYQRSTYEPV